MSFFTGKKASKKRSTTILFKDKFWILFAAVSCISLLFPINTYAQNTEESPDVEIVSAEGTESSSSVVSKTMYHKHTGSSENGGGCYTKEQTGTKTVEKECRGTMVYWPALGTSSCSKCGASYYGDESDRLCFKTTTETVTYRYYELGCNKKNSTVLGTLSVSKDTEEWVKSVVLTGTYDITGGLTLNSDPYIWNEESATSNNTCDVTACGEYSFSLNLKNKANVTGNKVTIEVRNIDVTSPAVSLSYDKDSRVQTVELEILAQDLQPDGTEGCGLHEMPYSFDGGNTWTDEKVFRLEQNGIVSIAVRDQLDNITYVEEQIANIDRKGPIITWKAEPDTWTNQDVKIYLSAEDVGDDGIRGAGIPDEWYSVDGGQSWLSAPDYTVTENQTIEVLARDLLGNQSKEKITISNIDREAPQIKAKVTLSGSNNKKAKIRIIAEDFGSGLHDMAYSWDKGVTFTADDYRLVSKNGTYQVWVRDKLGNEAKKNVKVDVIKDDIDEDPTKEPEETEEEEETTTPVPPQPQPEETETEEETEEDTTEEESITESETEEETTEELSTEPQSTEETLVMMEELVDEPGPVKVKELNQKDKWSVGEIVALIILVLAFLLLLIFLFVLWVRTIAIYAKNNAGQMEYKGRTWIHNREDRYEVDVDGRILEQCETTHLQFCPSPVFAKLHEGEDMHFLLPDGVCVTLPIAQKMEME